MTEQEINDSINKEFQQVFNRRHDYPNGLPFGFVSKFSLLLLHIPYIVGDGFAWGCSPENARKIIAKRDEDLTFLEVGIVVGLLLRGSQAMHFDTAEEAVDYVDELLDVKEWHNQKQARLTKELNSVKQRRMKIAGLDKGTAPFSKQ